MDNGIDWPTWIQACTSVVAIFLAIFMPSILKAVEKRDKAISIVRIFRLSVVEVDKYIQTAGDKIEAKLGTGEYPRDVAIAVLKNVIKKLEPQISSQLELLRSVPAVDLPFPGMAVMPSALKTSLDMLEEDIRIASDKNLSFAEIFAKYRHHQKKIREVVDECVYSLDQIQIDLSPHPVVQAVKKFFGSIN